MSKIYLKLFGGLLALLISIVLLSAKMSMTKSQTAAVLDKHAQVNSLNNNGRLAKNGDEKAIDDFAVEVFN